MRTGTKTKTKTRTKIGTKMKTKTGTQNMYILCIRRGPKLYKVYRGYTKPELYKKEMPPKKIHRLCSTHMMAYMYYKISSSKACSRVEKNTPGFTPNLIVKKSLPCQSFDFCQITQKTVFFFISLS